MNKPKTDVTVQTEMNTLDFAVQTEFEASHIGTQTECDLHTSSTQTAQRLTHTNCTQTDMLSVRAVWSQTDVDVTHMSSQTEWQQCSVTSQTYSVTLAEAGVQYEGGAIQHAAVQTARLGVDVASQTVLGNIACSSPRSGDVPGQETKLLTLLIRVLCTLTLNVLYSKPVKMLWSVSVCCRIYMYM